MEPEKINKRLDALDGLRGLAILLVALSHFEFQLLEEKGKNIFLQVLFDSGELGVGFLFILSGFLMVFLYSNPKSRLNFLQKRYTRIFPAFITVCVFLSIISMRENFFLKDFQLSLGLLFGLSAGVFLIWVYLIKKLSALGRRWIFLSFVALQFLVGVFYLTWVMRMPVTSYFEQVSFANRVLISGLVNLTLTLPLGSYVQPLSSVYWSLAAEVLFYVFYAVLAIPLIGFLGGQKRWIKYAFVLASLPFFVGFYLITSKVLFLDLLHIELAYFFVGGMVLGYLYKNNRLDFENRFFGNPVISYLSVFFIAAVLFLAHFSLNLTPPDWRPITKTFLAIPFSLVVLLLLKEKTLLSKFLSLKPLTLLGMVSYSLYLIHLFIFELWAKQFGKIVGFEGSLGYAASALAVSLAVAGVLFLFLEKPYFEGKKDESLSFSFGQKLGFLFRPKVIIWEIWVLILVMLAVGSSWGFKFLSLENSNFKEVILEPKVGENSKISLNDFKKVSMRTQAEYNNLSIVEMNIGLYEDPRKEFAKQTLIFRIRETGSENWQESKFSLNNREDILKNFYGFNPIPDSKGKSYDLELELDNPNSSKAIFLNIEPHVSKSIYFIEKTELISKPWLVGDLFRSKFLRMVTTWENQIILLLFAPFFGLSVYLIVRGGKIKDNV